MHPMAVILPPDKMNACLFSTSYLQINSSWRFFGTGKFPKWEANVTGAIVVSMKSQADDGRITSLAWK